MVRADYLVGGRGGGRGSSEQAGLDLLRMVVVGLVDMVVVLFEVVEVDTVEIVVRVETVVRVEIAVLVEVVGSGSVPSSQLPQSA